MYLQDQAGLIAIGLQPLMNIYHGDLDQLRSRTLDRRINRNTLVGLTQTLILRLQSGHFSPAAHQGCHIAVFLGLAEQAVDEQPDARIGIEVAVHQVTPFLDGDMQLLRHPERAGPIHDTEINHLGGPALIVIHIFRRYTKYNSRRAGVDILTLTESSQQRFFTRQVGHYPQFYLTVISREYAPALILGTKSPADLPAHISADRNILKIGVAAG